MEVEKQTYSAAVKNENKNPLVERTLFLTRQLKFQQIENHHLTQKASVELKSRPHPQNFRPCGAFYGQNKIVYFYFRPCGALSDQKKSALRGSFSLKNRPCGALSCFFLSEVSSEEGSNRAVTLEFQKKKNH